MEANYYDFEDVRLVPKKGIVESRDECNTEVVLGKHKFKIGAVPANMICSISEPMAIELAKNNYFYIHHRFNHDNVSFVKRMNEQGLMTSISIGVRQDSVNQIKQIAADMLSVDYVCIDIAHGHSVAMERMVGEVKKYLPDTFVIGGNVSTAHAVYELEQWGCDAIKAGIGPGAACTTYMMTNVGSRGWQASMINEITEAANVPIICDGGIRSIGHINVAFAMGSPMVMVGSLFSGFHDSPGAEILDAHGKRWKEFYGSASEYTTGTKRYSEGTKILIDSKDGTLLEYLNNEVVYGIRSCISYLGGNDMTVFKHAGFRVLR